MQQNTAAVAAGVELAEGDQVVDPVLAASQVLGGLNNVQPRRDDWGARWDESGSTLGYFGELLIGEPDGQLNHLGPPSMTRVTGSDLETLDIYDRERGETANEFQSAHLRRRPPPRRLRVRARLIRPRITARRTRVGALAIASPSQRRATQQPPMQTRCTSVRAVCDRCVTKSVAVLAFSRSSLNVMTAASIPAARGGDYARYLESKTVAPERGDYYLTPDGEMTQAAGRWLADPQTLERLDVRRDSPADGEDFVSLMEGRHPHTGRWLRRAGADGGRGGGIDSVFSAPKSVSVAWALADPWQRKQIENAHANAVEQTVEYMREHVPVVRRRYGGEVVEEPAKDLIAVEYRHTTARGVSGASAPDPQLHSHVVITSAIRKDDRIVAVASRPVFRAAGELGAFYRSVLAEELAREGYRIDHGTGRDGKYFEIAGVPEELREAFSGRSREVARAADRFRARYGRAPERGELRNLALENRRAKQLATRSASRTPGGRPQTDTTSVPTRHCDSSPAIVHPALSGRWRTGSRSD